MTGEEPDREDPEGRCPACHDTECCGAGPYIRDEKQREFLKQLADARAEYMLVESALVDAIKVMSFYGDERHHTHEESPNMRLPSFVDDDGGKAARVTLDRIFERLIAFARIQQLRPR